MSNLPPLKPEDPNKPKEPDHTIATQNHKQFWLVLTASLLSALISSIASPYVLHHLELSSQEHNHALDLANQKALLELTTQQSNRANQLDQQRRTYELKLQTVDELEQAIDALHKCRVTIMEDLRDYVIASAFSNVKADYDILKSEDRKQVTEVASKIKSESTELSSARDKVDSIIDKASIVFQRGWSDNSHRFLTPFDSGADSDFITEQTKQLEDSYKSLLIETTVGTLKSDKYYSTTAGINRLLHSANSKFSVTFQNAFNARYKDEDSSFNRVYLDCLQMLNPADDSRTKAAPPDITISKH